MEEQSDSGPTDGRKLWAVRQAPGVDGADGLEFCSMLLGCIDRGERQCHLISLTDQPKRC